MPQGKSTRQRLLDAAYLILSEDSLSDLSIARVTERAGVSKRSFFTHFTGKDQLLTELASHMRPIDLERYRAWADSCGPAAGVEDRVRAIFERIGALAQQPGWKGSGFIRISAELGDLTGHPVHGVAAAANRDMEAWFVRELRSSGFERVESIARQLVVLVNGLYILQLVHRSDGYAHDAIRLLPSIFAPGRPPAGAPGKTGMRRASAPKR